MYQLPPNLRSRIRKHKKEHGSAPTDSSVLRAALVDYAGVPDSNLRNSDRRVGYAITNQAHHIVEAGDKRANKARTILKDAGICVNSAANGVLLPSEHIDGTGEATIHLGSHVGEYAECVNRALEAAVDGSHSGTKQYRENVLTRLEQIREVLLTCNVPINGNVDADMTPQGGDVGEEQINDIFARKRLYDNLS